MREKECVMMREFLKKCVEFFSVGNNDENAFANVFVSKDLFEKEREI